MKECKIGIQTCRVDEDKRLYLDGAYIGCTPKEIPIFIKLRQREGEDLEFNAIAAWKRGDLLRTSGYELYLQYVYNGDEDALLDDWQHTDKRTRAYFSRLRQKAGYLHGEHRLNQPFDVPLAEAAEIPSFDSDAILVGRIDEAWCAQISGSSPSAGRYEIRYYFERRPLAEEISRMRMIEQLEEMFRLQSRQVSFPCRICGRTVHWLDYKADLPERKQALEQGWCGCETQTGRGKTNGSAYINRR